MDRERHSSIWELCEDIDAVNNMISKYEQKTPPLVLWTQWFQSLSGNPTEVAVKNIRAKLRQHLYDRLQRLPLFLTTCYDVIVELAPGEACWMTCRSLNGGMALREAVRTLEDHGLTFQRAYVFEPKEY